MLPIKFQLNPTYSFGGAAVWRIQDGRRGVHFWYRNDFSNSKFLCCSDASHQVLAQSDLPFGRRCCLKNFKMAAMGHLGYRNGKNVAILNLNVSPMPPTKLQLNSTYRSGADVVSRFSRWHQWILERNKFSTSKSPCHLNANHGLGSIWHAVRVLIWFEDFQDGYRGGHLGSRNGTIFVILYLYVTSMLPIKFMFNPTYGLGVDVV